jgi:hypothetical protein
MEGAEYALIEASPGGQAGSLYQLVGYEYWLAGGWGVGNAAS